MLLCTAILSRAPGGVGASAAATGGGSLRASRTHPAVGAPARRRAAACPLVDPRLTPRCPTLAPAAVVAGTLAKD